MNNQTDKEKWCENVIIADADYIDNVAFDLIVNFERMLGRRIPMADTSRWIDCIALDGGLREGDHNTQVIMIHSKDKKTMIARIFAAILAAIMVKRVDLPQ